MGAELQRSQSRTEALETRRGRLRWRRLSREWHYLGMICARRMSSLCHELACDMSQCDQRTVMADWRCVKPGISTSTSSCDGIHLSG